MTKRATVEEDVLIKALSDVEEQLEKGAMPDSTKEANGGLSTVGDSEELAVRSAAALDRYVAKAMDDESEEEEDDSDEDEDSSKSMDSEDEDDEDSNAGKKGKKVKKSDTLATVIKSDEIVGDAIDVYPSLSSIVDTLAESQTKLRKSVNQRWDEQGDFNSKLAQLTAANSRLLLEVKKSMDTLMALPQGQRRSVLHKSEVGQRFEGGQGVEGDAQQFTSGDVKKAMCALIEQGKLPVLSISEYEARGTMKPQVQRVVEAHLASNA